MILTCPGCATQFTIHPHLLHAPGREPGRVVRCARCKHQWRATPPLITLPGEMEAGLTNLAAALMPQAAPVAARALFAPTPRAGLSTARRNALVAALAAALLLISPFFFWRLASLEKVQAAATQKAIALDGTPSTKLYQEEGRNLLKIEGALINNDTTRRTVPRLQAKGMNAKGAVVKEWAIPLTAQQLEPGQRLPFSYTTPYSEQGVVDIAFHFM